MLLMLRNRSRAVNNNKQALMADQHHHCQSPSSPHFHKNNTPIPSFFGSPRFKAFTTTNTLSSSPKSTIFGNNHYYYPFWYLLNQSKPKCPKLLADSKAIGLALIDHDDKSIEEEDKSSSCSNKMVLFGTKLRVEIPPTEEVGVLTTTTECLSASEIELSEDYTCVISHGPNPKTTHIFDNCIIESYYSISHSHNNISSPKNFLSVCHTCKKNLEEKNDIYIYRGEKAFCSQECRYQEMLIDEVDA